MLRRETSPRDWLLFVLIASIPAAAMGLLANSALRGEEAAIGREMRTALGETASRLQGRVDRDALNDSLPYADRVLTSDDSAPASPRAPDCREHETSLLRHGIGDLPPDPRRAIVARCFRVKTGDERYAWPLIALAPGAKTPPALVAAWIDEVGPELPPAERAATKMDLRAAAWLGDQRASLTSALEATRGGDGSVRSLLAPHRTAMRAQRQEITWADARSRGRLRRREGGDYVGAVVHPGSIARALRTGWPALPEGMQAKLLLTPEPPTPSDVSLLPGGALVRLSWHRPDAIAQQTQRAQRLVVAAATGAAVLAIALASWLFARMRRERRLSALRTDFVAAVSHELRTPIASVRMLSELLAEDRVEEDERAEVVEGLAREAKRLGDTVDRLLRFSRMEAGRSDAARRETDVPALLTAVADDFDQRHPEAPLERDWPEALTFSLDAEAVAMALENLLGNAIKYAREGQPYRLTAAREGDALRLSVLDHGPGIARADQKRIFRAFERAADRLSEATEGSGIGLSLVQHVARSHGGQVALESAAGRGATFTLVIPARDSSPR